jgi:hypothetical protein
VSVLHRFRGEEGQELISALLLLTGVLLPLLFLVPLFARIEQGRLAVEQTARDAVRAAVEAPSPSAAQQAAQAAVGRAQQATDARLQLTLSGAFVRGGVLHAQAQTEVDVASLPFVGSLGTITVTGTASAPVDQYRSLLTTQQPEAP